MLYWSIPVLCTSSCLKIHSPKSPNERERLCTGELQCIEQKHQYSTDLKLKVRVRLKDHGRATEWVIDAQLLGMEAKIQIDIR